jgi:hypothetical protein
MEAMKDLLWLFAAFALIGIVELGAWIGICQMVRHKKKGMQ